MCWKSIGSQNFKYCYVLCSPILDACESDWEPFGGYCYYAVHLEWVTFSEAESACQRLGAHLASIHSQDEQGFVAGKLNET